MRISDRPGSLLQSVRAWHFVEATAGAGPATAPGARARAVVLTSGAQVASRAARATARALWRAARASALFAARGASWIWSFEPVRVASAALATVALVGTWALAYRIYFDRSNLPDVEPFIRFEPPTTGVVYETRGGALIEVAHEYRRVVTYDQVPDVLRQAVLAAEDKDFFSHDGLEYGAWPRVVWKSLRDSAAAWRRGGDSPRVRFPQGGSTITQQLVRGYFLQDLTQRENEATLASSGLLPRLAARLIGVQAANKLARKLEEMRLSVWIEDELRRRYGSKERAKREIFARYASFLYLGNGRYGFAAGSEYYFGKPLGSYRQADAGEAAALAGISKSPKDYAPAPGNRAALRRRNQILALMAREGYVPPQLAELCQLQPLKLAARARAKTEAPAAIETVFAELKRVNGARFATGDLFSGRIAVHSTVDERVQGVVNAALEHGLEAYEKRHPKNRGLIQGSVVVLRNSDGGILAEAGGRETYRERDTQYQDFNRATQALRQPGSAMKPLVYLAALRSGLALDTLVPDMPIAVPMGNNRGLKWIANYDNQFKGMIPLREALAESRNAVAIWIVRQVGMPRFLKLARDMGIETPLAPYVTTALGASEVRLLELAGAYRTMASGIVAEPHIIASITGPGDEVLYTAPAPAGVIPAEELCAIQEGLRGVVRLPDGTAHSLDGAGFPQVMGKTGTSSDFRDALFVGSTYGPQGITVAVRVGFDDNRVLGEKETGGRAALPVFREIMREVYTRELVGPAPKFPPEIEEGIDNFMTMRAAAVPAPDAETPAATDQAQPVATLATMPVAAATTAISLSAAQFQ